MRYPRTKLFPEPPVETLKMPIDSSAVKHWDPSQFLQGRASHKYSVIVLHQPIEDVLRFAAICKGGTILDNVVGRPSELT